MDLKTLEGHRTRARETYKRGTLVRLLWHDPNHASGLGPENVGDICSTYPDNRGMITETFVIPPGRFHPDEELCTYVHIVSMRTGQRGTVEPKYIVRLVDEAQSPHEE
jgi:hypothetical protein